MTRRQFPGDVIGAQFVRPDITQSCSADTAESFSSSR
jgi:hypothetical protein